MSASPVLDRPLRIVLAAEESAGATVLRTLLARGHDVVAVVSAGTGGALGSSVAEQARRQGVPVRPTSDLRTPAWAHWLEQQRVDVLLNVHSLVIAAGEVVDAPRWGSYNLHPGPLPEYAGLDVPSWAVLRGERQHGVTLHRMTSTVDAGAIAYSSTFDLDDRDTALTVFSACVRDGSRLVGRLLDDLERGQAPPAVPQDLTRRRWFSAGPPDGGQLDWDRPAADVVAFVRACDYGPFTSPWGHPRCWLRGAAVEVLRASTTGCPADRSPGTIGPASADGVLVAAADRWVRVEQLRVEGRRCDPAEVLPGGDRLLGAHQPA